MEELEKEVKKLREDLQTLQKEKEQKDKSDSGMSRTSPTQVYQGQVRLRYVQDKSDWCRSGISQTLVGLA